MAVIQFAHLQEDAAKAFLAEKPVMLLPIGAVEVHGDHLPLCTDTLLGTGVANKVAARLEKAAVLPPLPYGQVWSLRDFPGSIDISNDTLAHTIADIGRSLDRFGVPKLAMINGHVGNMVAMKQAARILWEEGRAIKTYYFTYPGADKKAAEVCETPRPHSSYFHACEIETSYMLYLAGEFVHMEKALRNYPDFPADFDTSPSPWSSVLNTAVLGDAPAATAAKGEAIIEHVVNEIVRIIENS